MYKFEINFKTISYQQITHSIRKEKDKDIKQRKTKEITKNITNKQTQQTDNHQTENRERKKNKQFHSRKKKNRIYFDRILKSFRNLFLKHEIQRRSRREAASKGQRYLFSHKFFFFFFFIPLSPSFLPPFPLLFHPLPPPPLLFRGVSESL